MKKRVVTILTLALLLSACGNAGKEAEESKRGHFEIEEEDEETGDRSKEEDEESGSSSKDEEPVVEEEKVSEDAGTDISGEEEDDPQVETIFGGEGLLTLGTISGDTYENEVIGYGCTLKGWNFGDEEGLLEVNRQLSGFASSDVKELIKNSKTFIEMYADSADKMQNINVQFQNKKAVYGSLSGLDLIIDGVVLQMPSILEGSGYSDIQVEKTTIEIAGDKLPGIYIQGKINGIPIYQTEALIERDEYVVFMTVTSYYDNKADEVFSQFYKVGGR